MDDKKETGIGQGTLPKVGQRHRGGKELTECREPQQLKTLGHQVTAGGRAREQDCTEAQTKCFQAQRKETVGNGNVFVEEAAELGS